MTGFQRGDVVLFARSAPNDIPGQPYSERTRITLGLVTSVTREGQIKAFRDLHVNYHEAGAGTKIANSLEKYATRYRLPKADWNVESLADYVANRPWSHNPEHKGMPFDSVEQAREELRKFKLMR